MQTSPKRRRTTTLRLLLPYTLDGVHAVDEADMAVDGVAPLFKGGLSKADIAADIAAGDGAIRCLLKDFKQRVADFLRGNTGGTTHSRYDIETA